MTTRLTALALLAAAALTGCATTAPMTCPAPVNPEYTPAEASGLVPVRPFPNPNSVCQVIGENDATRDLLDDSALLIACPKIEPDAIENRIAEGGRVVACAADCTLQSMPARD